MYENPNVDDFKYFFYRDFPYCPSEKYDDTNYVLDRDIQRAIEETAIFINSAFASTQESYTNQFLYLTAHNMVMNLRSSSQGLNGQYSWLQNSRGAGGVSESLAIPDRILENPELAMLAKTNYGAKYLLMIIPQISGQVFTVCGGTRAE